MPFNNTWKCANCNAWNRDTLRECPNCGWIHVDPEAETKIMPPVKLKEKTDADNSR